MLQLFQLLRDVEKKKQIQLLPGRWPRQGILHTGMFCFQKDMHISSKDRKNIVRNFAIFGSKTEPIFHHTCCKLLKNIGS